MKDINTKSDTIEEHINIIKYCQSLFKSLKLSNKFLNFINQSHDENKYIEIFIVGGIIRDFFYQKNHSKNISSKDIDLITESCPIKLIESLKYYFTQEEFQVIKVNRPYQTVELKIGEVRIDIARSREETYCTPAENPIIIESEIEKDLKRRDFNINSIAYSIRKNEYIDYFQGREFIKKGEFNLLHNKSIFDDPTRVIRAARYSARLGFSLSNDSIIQIKSTIKSWPWDWKNNLEPELAPPALSSRLRMEFELLFKETNYIKAIKDLQDWGGICLLDQKLESDNKCIRRAVWAKRIGISKLVCLISGAENSLKIAKRLGLKNSEQISLNQSIHIKNHLFHLIKSERYSSWQPSDWCDEIEGLNFRPDAFAIAICQGVPLWANLYKWYTRWRYIKPDISAKDLIKDGWEPGPKIGIELKRLRKIKLNSNRNL